MMLIGVRVGALAVAAGTGSRGSPGLGTSPCLLPGLHCSTFGRPWGEGSTSLRAAAWALASLKMWFWCPGLFQQVKRMEGAMGEGKWHLDIMARFLIPQGGQVSAASPAHPSLGKSAGSRVLGPGSRSGGDQRPPAFFHRLLKHRSAMVPHNMEVAVTSCPGAAAAMYGKAGSPGTHLPSLFGYPLLLPMLQHPSHRGMGDQKPAQPEGTVPAAPVAQGRMPLRGKRLWLTSLH